MNRIIFLSIFVFAAVVALPAAAATPDGAEGPWADTVEVFSQTTTKNGGVIDANRSIPEAALGEAESTGADYDNPVIAGSFVSLGFDGSITLGFTNYIVNEAGDDLQLYEVTGGSSYPDEDVMVEASQYGVIWTTLETSVTRDAEIDLGSLPWAQYVRITDVSNISNTKFNGSSDGFDLDGVKALHSAESVDLGCTYTQGYWKNHKDVWPVDELILGDNLYEVGDVLEILDTPVKGNGYISLAHQLIATLLNIANGADYEDVVHTIVDAHNLIGDVDLLGDDTIKTSEVSNLVETLDMFNNGEIGPGHCDL